MVDNFFFGSKQFFIEQLCVYKKKRLRFIAQIGSGGYSINVLVLL